MNPPPPRLVAKIGACLVVLALVLVRVGPRPAAATDLPSFAGRLSRFIYLKPVVPVPPTRFRGGDGRTVTFAQFHGKVVLVNLWATWCAPCAAEMPALDRLQERLGGDRFAVVTVALDSEGLPPVASFFQRHNLTHLQIYLDPEHRAIRSGAGMAAPLPLNQLPTSYLLDREGRALGYLKGPAEWDSLQAIGFLQFFIDADKN